MRNFLLPTVKKKIEEASESGEDRSKAYKISEELADRVVCEVVGRFKGVKLTKRAALEVALSEWLKGVSK